MKRDIWPYIVIGITVGLFGLMAWQFVSVYYFGNIGY
jgi:hypothetical protein